MLAGKPAGTLLECFHHESWDFFLPAGRAAAGCGVRACGRHIFGVGAGRRHRGGSTERRQPARHGGQRRAHRAAADGCAGRRHADRPRADRGQRRGHHQRPAGAPAGGGALAQRRAGHGHGRVPARGRDALHRGLHRRRARGFTVHRRRALGGHQPGAGRAHRGAARAGRGGVWLGRDCRRDPDFHAQGRGPVHALRGCGRGQPPHGQAGGGLLGQQRRAGLRAGRRARSQPRLQLQARRQPRPGRLPPKLGQRPGGRADQPGAPH